MSFSTTVLTLLRWAITRGSGSPARTSIFAGFVKRSTVSSSRNLTKPRRCTIPSNLHALPVKLLVVKKHSGILENLVKDLKIIETRLTDLPTLIIDDESDQAGINTVDPKRRSRKDADTERSKTNRRIVELLRLFPRGQYVGYTATPYANALVDPDDIEDLFPKDFIISLDRPSGLHGGVGLF